MAAVAVFARSSSLHMPSNVSMNSVYVPDCSSSNSDAACVGSWSQTRLLSEPTIYAPCLACTSAIDAYKPLVLHVLHLPLVLHVCSQDLAIYSVPQLTGPLPPEYSELLQLTVCGWLVFELNCCAGFNLAWY